MRRPGVAEEKYGTSRRSVREEENERLQEGLTTKARALKHITIDIRNELKIHNGMLGKMDSAFDSTGGLLGATVGRLKLLSRGSQNKAYCYMLVFALFVFIILYCVIRPR